MNEGHVDHVLFVITMLLVGIGLTMVYSASSITSLLEMEDSLYYFKRQLLWASIGILVMLILANTNYHTYEKIALPLFIIAIIFLILVLVPGISREIGGARRWIRVGTIGFQPSEFAKLAWIIFLAKFLKENQSNVKSFLKCVLPVLALATLIFGLILKQPNLSTASIIMSSTLILLFLANASFFHLLILVSSSLVMFIALIFQKEYRLRRFFAFLDPWQDYRSSGYHIIQSLIAIGSGGIWGLGLGHSRQKFHILPERHTDFIFSIICEELGLVAALVIIFLLGLLIYRCFYIAVRAPDMYGFLLASGFGTIIALQTVINLGVVLSLLPTTGVTLPFISYGGSSIIFLLASIGIILNISKYGSFANAFAIQKSKTCLVLR